MPWSTAPTGAPTTSSLPDLDAAGRQLSRGSIVELRKIRRRAGPPRVALAVRSDLDHRAQDHRNRRHLARPAGHRPRAGSARRRRLRRRGAPGDGPARRPSYRPRARRASDARRQLLAARSDRHLAPARGRSAGGEARGRDRAAHSRRPERASMWPAPIASASTLASGRFAMIDDGLGFQLVPWSPSLETSARPARLRRLPRRRRRRLELRPQARPRHVATTKQGVPRHVGDENPLGPDPHRLPDRVDDDLGARHNGRPIVSASSPSSARPGSNSAGWPIYYPPAFFWWWYFYDAYAPPIFVEGAYHRRLGRLHLHRRRHRHVGLAGARSEKRRDLWLGPLGARRTR